MIFTTACAALNLTCLLLSPVALIWSAFYSHTKRFTPLCHFVLGSVLGLAPVAGWLAVSPSHLGYPAVLLFSHRSYLDGVIVPVAMQENRLPPVHTFAGINLAFGLMGPIFRHSGVIFIRRNINNFIFRN